MGQSSSKRSRRSSSAASTNSSRNLSRASTMESVHENSIHSSTNSLHKTGSSHSLEPTAPPLTEANGEFREHTFQTDVRQRRRFEEAANENLQNQWTDITGDGRSMPDADMEFAQNLANEDNESARHSGLENESVEEQREILERIRAERERDLTDAAITASMSGQLEELSERRAGRESWRLQGHTGDTGQDDVDGTVPYNRDWSRLYNFDEWKGAFYTVGATIAIPFIIVFGIVYYLIKGLIFLGNAGQYFYRSRNPGIDSVDGSANQRSRANNQIVDIKNSPIMLLIFPIMLPIWIIQGISKVATEAQAVRSQRIVPARAPTFHWPSSLRFNLGRGRSHSRGFRAPRFHGASPINFNRNRPCKCRCNECTIM